LDEGGVRFLLNVRYPVTWKGSDMRSRCEAKLAALGEGFRLELFDDSPSLYFPLDHPLVKTICDVYEAETGERKTPGVMGGGTYARAIPNTVSIGTGWSGDGGAHENDERVKVEHLYKMSRIYAHILVRLANIAGGRA
jgi:succinyl-diaminopimelate desuccinylase